MILFQHRPVERLTARGTETVDVTIATILPQGYTGMAVRNPGDPYDEWQGREYALERAIADLPWDARGDIWTEFFTGKAREAEIAQAEVELAEVNRLLDLTDELTAQNHRISFDLLLTEDALIERREELLCKL